LIAPRFVERYLQLALCDVFDDRRNATGDEFD